MRFIIGLLVLVALHSCRPETNRQKGFEVHGIDVSHYQSKIDWDTVLLQDIDFVFIKATEGESLQDSFFVENWKLLERQNVLRGAYHFFHPSVSIEGQFNNFTKVVDLQYKDLAPVVDIEVTNGKSPSFLRQALKEYLSKLEAHYQIRPIIYTNQKLYNEYLQGAFEDYPLWIARYNDIEPALVDGRNWDFWQYGDRGQLYGIKGDVDLNVYKWTLDSLKTMTVPLRDTSNKVVVVDPL